NERRHGYLSSIGRPSWLTSRSCMAAKNPLAWLMHSLGCNRRAREGPMSVAYFRLAPEASRRHLGDVCRSVGTTRSPPVVTPHNAVEASRRPPGSATRRLVGPLAARSPGLRLALALEVERHRSADEVLQGRLIDLVAFTDVDGAPDVPVEARVEQT